MNIVLVFIFVVSAFTPRWTTQTSGVTVRLRGVSAVSEQIAWSSGASSTVLRTTDGGTTWKKLTVTSDTLCDGSDDQNTSLPNAPLAPAPQPLDLRGTKLKVSKPGPSILDHVCPSSSE